MLKPRPKQRPWQIRSQQPQRPMEGRKRVDFYHTARWKNESKMFRDSHPLCAICEKNGLVEASEMVDHIIPLEICEDPWDQKNWQAVSRKCNNIKAAQDKKMIQKNR